MATTTTNTADARRRMTVRPDPVSAVRLRPAGAPAYYLGRPAQVWLAAYGPRPRHGASPSGDAAAAPRPPVHRATAVSLASSPAGHDELPPRLVA